MTGGQDHREIGITRHDPVQEFFKAHVLSSLVFIVSRAEIREFSKKIALMISILHIWQTVTGRIVKNIRKRKLSQLSARRAENVVCCH